MSGVACTLASPACFYLVNVSGLGFEQTLQATVAQGLANRRYGAKVYVVGIDKFPGMTGIEWFPGTGCEDCSGLRQRWLNTVAAAQPTRQIVELSAADIVEQVRPLLNGGALFSVGEPHALGPVLTASGVHDLLPATSLATLPRGLTVRFDGRHRWPDATAAAWYTGRVLLPLTNQSTFAFQAPTNLPFLADAVVAWRLPLLWMDDVCRSPAQQAAFRWLVEGSSHFDSAPVVQYVGWFNNTHLPNVELLCQCTARKRLVTIASDFTENLSYLSSLPASTATPSTPLAQPPDAVRVHGGYSPTMTYVSIVVSDGDNIAQDWSNLRPMLERRLSLHSKVPLSWTLSNRWATFGAPVLEWFYTAARQSHGYDSFLMGPSGYGYTFPGAMEDDGARRAFGQRTIDAAAALGMEAYVHWDVDQALDPSSRLRTQRAIAMYNQTAVRGVFMLGSDPVDDVVGDVMVINKPALPWGFANATSAAATLNALPQGTITYAYVNMKADPELVDELALALQPHVKLLGYRELIRVARLARGPRRL